MFTEQGLRKAEQNKTKHKIQQTNRKGKKEKAFQLLSEKVT